MLIYLLQIVWFNGGFKREYCWVKILEYSIWIFKVAVKVFGAAPGVGSAASPVAPGVGTPLPWPLEHSSSQRGSWQARGFEHEEQLEVPKGGVNALEMLCEADLGPQGSGWCGSEQWGSVGQEEQGHRLCCRVDNSVTVPQKGDICLFIFSVFTMLCLPLFWGNIFFDGKP